VAVCRELTKVHEEIVRGTAAELAERYRDAPPRGEVVLVVGGAAARGGAGAGGGGAAEPAAEAVDALARLVEAGAKPRPAAAVVAGLTGEGANALYRALQSRD
jgi:16S rRNA (cytidine1402-2'-O)-methyltransferase